jgi:hypothetical protein
MVYKKYSTIYITFDNQRLLMTPAVIYISRNRLDSRVYHGKSVRGDALTE